MVCVVAFCINDEFRKGFRRIFYSMASGYWKMTLFIKFSVFSFLNLLDDS